MSMVGSSVSILGGNEELYETTGRKPNPVDVHVGSRVRYRRMIIGMSQEKLGEKMNLTFQQIQKYEKGTNRIGASRLFQLSKISRSARRIFLRGCVCQRRAVEPVAGVA